MPAATNQTDLRAITPSEFGKLSKLLDSVPAAAQSAMDPEADNMTLKDLVGHRAEWIALFLGWYRDGQAGKSVSFPAPGYKWSDLKRFNSDLRETQSDLNWNSVRASLETNHARLCAFIDDQDNESLYGGPMQGAHNAWTAGRWAEAAGASHYRSASKYVRTRLRAFKKDSVE